MLFVIQLDRSLKEIHSHAIISLNIQDEKRVSPIPVMGYADDIAFVYYSRKSTTGHVKCSDSVHCSHRPEKDLLS